LTNRAFLHILGGMIIIAPEVIAVEEAAARHGIRMADVLDGVGVAQSTWWRWRHKGIEPHLKTLRKVRSELDRVVADKPGSHGASAPVVDDAATMAPAPAHGADNRNQNITRTGEAA
jgi:transcriptional regulator with XRE-family HTH domain